MIGTDPPVPTAAALNISLLILLSLAFLPFQVCRGGESQAPRIRAIEVKGNKKVETSTIQFYIRIRVGDEFSVTRIREDILRIYRLGFFKDVQVDVEEFEGGLRVTFIVVEEPLVRNIIITGTQAIKREEVEGKLALKANAVLNRNQVRDSLDKIKQLYQEKGYYFAEAEALYQTRGFLRVEVGEPEVHVDQQANGIFITIAIKEQDQFRVGRVRVEGDDLFSADELKRLMRLPDGETFARCKLS